MRVQPFARRAVGDSTSQAAGFDGRCSQIGAGF